MVDEGVEATRKPRLGAQLEVKPSGESAPDVHAVKILKADLASVDVVL